MNEYFINEDNYVQDNDSESFGTCYVLKNPQELTNDEIIVATYFGKVTEN